jgi:hypothetical protein
MSTVIGRTGGGWVEWPESRTISQTAPAWSPMAISITANTAGEDWVERGNVGVERGNIGSV